MATKGPQRPGGRPGASPPPSIPHDRLVFLLLALVGSKVVATVKGGQRFSGILSAATADGEVNLALRQAQLVDDPSAPLRSSLLIQAKDLQELSALDISLDSRPSERDAFKTDTEVTGLASDRKEKELQAWGAGTGLGGAGGIGDTLGGLSLDDEQRGQGGAKAWDQFATNERLYGTRTDYHEELYTTKLDRSGADYRQREQRAAQLEREILKGGGGGALANNAHIAEERGVVDDSGLTEEDRYSGVIRGSGAYVPPGARKSALSRSVANGSSTTNGSSSSPSPAPTSQSLAASAASAQLQDPSIISVTSRLPVTSSSTSRIPAAVTASNAAAADGAQAGKPTAPTVEGSFRQFVSFERQRLMEKKHALAKAAERQDKDSKLASLLEFSQTFKLKSPMPADIAEIAGHGERKPVPAASTSKPTTTLTPTANAPSTSASTSASPAVSPVRIARALTPASGAAPAPAAASAAKQPPRFAGASTLIAEIPPFNPNRAKAKAAEAAAAAAGRSAGGAAATAPALAKTPSLSGGAAAAPAPSVSPALSASTASKINPNAPAFVFRPNPNASSFTPGFAARKPSEPQGPVNPFFGTKQIKKGSSSMHVKEDFTPFKTGLVSEPVTILPNWSFTGKPYRSMYPHAPSPTPPPMGMPGAGGPDDGGADLPGSLPMHHGAPPPPPPQGYGAAMGVYGGGGFGPQGGFNPRFAPPQPPMQHLPPGAMNGNMQFPPPPPPQHFAPPPPPNMGFGGAPPGPPSESSFLSLVGESRERPRRDIDADLPSLPPSSPILPSLPPRLPFTRLFSFVSNPLPRRSTPPRRPLSLLPFVFSPLAVFNSPQMQPQPGAYMRYNPFPPGGPGGPGGPPQGGAQ
ncbi:hypothetical protein BCR35DRAFT_304976 [Leucosporidium creatinivorum]|uniref:LsmAD domain-containing protein n=1 Tax=Leucosporidium creatinivorum TaxID=106004 RepID=A0A1Y2F3C6_9BASI|nr:hypothetical protein BCR35DRAFT_304976 [Leucosporidium creatinivorum]